MIDKDPSTFSLATYIWVAALSLLGGLITAWKTWLNSKQRTYTISHFGLDLLSSSLAGLITFWLATAAEINALVTATLIAISGTMGTRAINELQFFWKRWIRSQ